jgi:hypothetical protein
LYLVFSFYFADKDFPDGNDFLLDVLKLMRGTEAIPEKGPIPPRTVSHHLYLFVTYHVIRCRPAVFSALSQYYGEDVAQAWQKASQEMEKEMWEDFDPSTILVCKSGAEASVRLGDKDDLDDGDFKGRKARRRDMMSIDFSQYLT